MRLQAVLGSAMVAMGLMLGGCAAELAEPEVLDTAEQIDEARTPSWERFVGAWTGEVGSYSAVIFTREAAAGTSHVFFADRVVQCIRAPCPAVRERGTYRATSDYLYLAVNGETQRYSWTLRDETLWLRQGRTVIFRLHAQQGYCSVPSDCGAQNLPLPRCAGAAFTCNESRCGTVCGAPSGCATNSDCPDDQFCSGTTCGGRGTCSRRPQACTALYNPVCGCDNRTYGNACSAANSGVRVASTGACRPPAGRCFSNDDCTGGAMYCQKDSCGQALGTCRQITVRCSGAYIPVCGCDGETYNNACMALTAGQNVDHDGVCATR